MLRIGQAYSGPNSCPKDGDAPKSPFPATGSVNAIGRHRSGGAYLAFLRLKSIFHIRLGSLFSERHRPCAFHRIVFARSD